MLRIVPIINKILTFKKYYERIVFFVFLLKIYVYEIYAV
jgi:hypothetical protein